MGGHRQPHAGVCLPGITPAGTHSLVCVACRVPNADPSPLCPQRESLDVIGRIGFQTDFGSLQHYRTRKQRQRAAAAGNGGGDGSGAAAQAAPPTAEEDAVSANIGLDDLFAISSGCCLEVAQRWSQPLRMRLRWVLPVSVCGGSACHGSQGPHRLIAVIAL